MKRTLLTLLLVGAIGLGSCSNKSNLPNKIITTKAYPKEMIVPHRKKNEEEKINLTRINEEYLQKFLENSKFFNNHFELSQSISVILKNKEHTYRLKENNQNAILSEQIYQTYDLSLSQNQKIYLMIKSLKDSSFLNQIGQIIENDIPDKYSEHGGVITISPKLKLELNVIESENAKNKIEENNNFYQLPEWAYAIPHIAKFHLHSESYNESKFAGPGIQDQITSKNSIDAYGLSNEFIITPIKKGEFNMDYLGGDSLLSKKTKSIDLGNYEYDSTKITFK